MLGVVISLSVIFPLVTCHSLLSSLGVEGGTTTMCYYGDDDHQSYGSDSSDSPENQQERDVDRNNKLDTKSKQTEQTDIVFETANFLGDLGGFCGGGIMPPYPEYPQFPPYAPYPFYPPEPMYPEYPPNPPFPAYPENPLYPPNPPYAPFPSYPTYPAYPSGGGGILPTLPVGGGNDPLPTNGGRPNVINVNFVQDVLHALQSFQSTSSSSLVVPPFPKPGPSTSPSPSPIAGANSRQSRQRKGKGEKKVKSRSKSKSKSKSKSSNKRPFFSYVGRMFRVF